MTRYHEFDELDPPETCPQCGDTDALMDMTLGDIIYQNNAARASGWVRVEQVTHDLRAMAEAYPEDVFSPLTDADREAHPDIIQRASAGMGRHLSKRLAELADQLESITSRESEAERES
jgi:hypothetical protein